MKQKLLISTSILLMSISCQPLFAGELSQDHLSIDLSKLSRDGGNSVTYLYDNNGTVNSSGDDTPLANTGSFNDAADLGYRLSGSKNITSNWSVNAGILRTVMDKTDSFSSTSSVGRLEIFRSPLTNEFDAAHSVVANYNSKLSGEELNLVYQLNTKLDVLLGLSHYKLDERFRITSDDTHTAGVGVYTMNTSNDMLGLQIGLAANHKWSENLGGYLVGKIGSYNNDATQSQYVDDSSFTRTNSGSKSGSSMMYDIRLGINYYYSKQVVLNLGYQSVKLTNVALAEKHFNTTTTGSNTVDSSSDITWNGLNAGLKYNF